MDRPSGRDRLLQVGHLRVEEGLALTRDAPSSSSAARLTAPRSDPRWMRSISAWAGEPHAACRPRPSERQVDLGRGQQLEILRAAEAAACSSSCSLTIASRIGCRPRSKLQAPLVGARGGGQARRRRCAAPRALLAFDAHGEPRSRAARSAASPIVSSSARPAAAAAVGLAPAARPRPRLRARPRRGAHRGCVAVNCAPPAPRRSVARNSSRAAASATLGASPPRRSSALRSCTACRAAGRAPRSGLSAATGAPPAPRGWASISAQLLASRRCAATGRLRPAASSAAAHPTLRLRGSGARASRRAQAASRRSRAGGSPLRHASALRHRRRSAPARAAAGARGSRSPARARAGRPARSPARRSSPRTALTAWPAWR